jgi:hypothetical protein
MYCVFINVQPRPSNMSHTTASLGKCSLPRCPDNSAVGWQLTAMTPTPRVDDTEVCWHPHSRMEWCMHGACLGACACGVLVCTCVGAVYTVPDIHVALRSCAFVAGRSMLPITPSGTCSSCALCPCVPVLLCVCCRVHSCPVSVCAGVHMLC